ncbi:MAG: arginine--tRNA ligase [Minisyncoccia bacterium]
MIKKLEKRLKIIAKKFLGDDFKKIEKDIKVFLTENLKFGDYSSNILFLIAKIKKGNPSEFFQFFKDELEKISYIEKVEFLNGYLNLFLDRESFFDIFKKILRSKDEFLRNDIGKKKKVIIEYVSANPTGPLTIGNGRGAVLGDVLSKILSLLNYKVYKEYYVNDIGRQVDLLAETILYHLKKREYSDDLYKGDYLKDIAEKYKDKFLKLDKDGIKKFLVRYILSKLIKDALLKFGTKFDNFYFESDLYKRGLDKKILKILNDKNLLEGKDGAIWLKLTKFGEKKDEVLIRKNGLPTYFFSDILYNYDKFFIRKFDYSIIIVASDHLDHVRRLQKTFEYIFNIKEDRFKFIVYQFVHLIKDEKLLKISKRRGTYIRLDDLIEDVGVDPIRFFFLKYSPDVTVNFDLELAKKEKEENPIWYLHYTYARFNSIIKIAKKKKIYIPKNFDVKKVYSFLIKKDEYLKIFRIMNRLPLLICKIAEDLKPHTLSQFLIETAKELNSFYEKERILDGDEKEIKFKLIFVLSILKFLELAFSLLSIRPKKILYKFNNKDSN